MPRHKTLSRKRVAVALLTGVVLVVTGTVLRGGSHTSQRRVGIVGGVPVASSTLPALSYVRIRWGRRVVQCAGALVTGNAILTAAHCLENSHTGRVAAAAQVRVLVGHLDNANAHHPGLTIRRVVTFDRPQLGTENADVAILVMDAPTTLPPIILTSEDSWSGAPGAEMIGWSADNLLPHAVLDIQFSRPEKVAAQTIVQTSGWCEENVSHFNPRYDICAIHPPSYNTGGCVGASGSPLIANGVSPPVEIGMMIRGSVGCSTRRPTVFIRISAVRGWITSHLTAFIASDGNDTNATGL